MYLFHFHSLILSSSVKFSWRCPHFRLLRSLLCPQAQLILLFLVERPVQGDGPSAGQGLSQDLQLLILNTVRENITKYITIVELIYSFELHVPLKCLFPCLPQKLMVSRQWLMQNYFLKLLLFLSLWFNGKYINMY